MKIGVFFQIVICLISVLLIQGCAGGKQYVPPKLERNNAAILKRYGVKKQNASYIYIVRIDGQRVASSMFPQFESERELFMTPGVHTIAVGFNDGHKYSTMLGEITFSAEAGKQYYISGWPPVIYDYQTDKFVPHKVRGTPR